MSPFLFYILLISFMHLSMANQGGNSTVLRDYRRGNWKVEETMVLIEAKKMDDERRMKRLGEGEGRSKPAELRWRWVEDYCWRNGCLRSQNQCNDKWDNLMRDFKKVRDYERRVEEKGGEEGSYWKIEKNERKERNLPSNMLPQIYEKLVEVVEKKVTSNVQRAFPAETSAGYTLQQPSLPPPPLPPLLPLPPPPPPPPSLSAAQPLPAVDSDTSEHLDSPAKRRRRGEEGRSSKAEEVGSAITKSASMIAEAIQETEEGEERRHREMLSLQERRMEMEKSKTEITRQGLNGLVDAINKLANSILALASSQKSGQSIPK